MIKKTLTIIITLLILIALSFGLSHYLHSKFYDYSFFVGLEVTVVIWFFTSKGGITSRSLDLTVQGTTGIKTEKQKFEFSPNLAFITSLVYTVVTFALMIFEYRRYF